MEELPKTFLDFIETMASLQIADKDAYQKHFPQGVLITDEPWDLPGGGFGPHDAFQGDHQMSRHWSLRFIKAGRAGIV